MTLWSLLGFGVNHERIAKYNQKAIEDQNTSIINCCNTIKSDGIYWALRYEENELIIAVLKNWKDAQIWLKFTDWWENKDIYSYNPKYLDILKSFNKQAKSKVEDAEIEYKKMLERNKNANWFTKVSKGSLEKQNNRIYDLKSKEAKTLKAITELEEWLLNNKSPEVLKLEKTEQELKLMQHKLEELEKKISKYEKEHEYEK